MSGAVPADLARQRVRDTGVVVVLRGDFGLEGLLGMARTLVSAGLDVLEVTLNSADALAAIRALREEHGGTALIGAGTCRNAADVRSALEAGASFTVAPNLDEASAAAAHEQGRLHLPGVFTATEVQRAVEAGCAMVKLFPCDAVGPGYVKALRAPYADVEFIAVGGVSAANAASFLAAGAMAVGAGGSLTRHAGDAGALFEEAKGLAEAVRAARGTPRA